MTDVEARSGFLSSARQRELVTRTIIRRRRAEKRFQIYGIVAVSLACIMLLLLLVSIVGTGWSAFLSTQIRVEVDLPKAEIDPDGKGAEAIQGANLQALIEDGLIKFLKPQSRDQERLAAKMLSAGADTVLREILLADPSLIGKSVTIWVPAFTDIDMAVKGVFSQKVPETERLVNDQQFAWIDRLAQERAIERRFNWRFFSAADSNEPELAGILGALSGTAYTMLVTLLLCFPVAVAAAIYLEEFSRKSRFTDLIEVNINNLAAVPSIIFGLLGLAVFLNFFGLPRSVPLVGGMVLSLLVLPTIIIATRASLKAVPPSIREAAYGLGASKMQVITHHVLPLAMPGILTGTIIGMAHALGETAPLLMIGMKAFIAAPPVSPTDPATALPAQVFIWADKPQRGFAEKTAAAILVLLVFLIFMNAIAIYLRKKFERRW
jgi:phosphate transport system permease protein